MQMSVVSASPREDGNSHVLARSRHRRSPLGRPRRPARLSRRLRRPHAGQLPAVPPRRGRQLLARRPLRRAADRPHAARRRHHLRDAAVLLRHAGPAEDGVRPAVLLHREQRPSAGAGNRRNHGQEGRRAHLLRGELRRRDARRDRPVPGTHPISPPGLGRRGRRQREQPRRDRPRSQRPTVVRTRSGRTALRHPCHRLPTGHRAIRTGVWRCDPPDVSRTSAARCGCA